MCKNALKTHFTLTVRVYFINMKIIYLATFILINVSQVFAQNTEIRKTFVTFQSAILNQNCEQLTEISRFPIEGDMGLARLVNSDPPRIDMKKHNYEISNELLIHNCAFLDSIEMKVLEQFSIDNSSNNHGIEYDGCIYKANLSVNEDSSYFQWSVGCSEPTEDIIGEYSMVFTFKYVEGKYKLISIVGFG